jgi:hypothetical protein
MGLNRAVSILIATTSIVSWDAIARSLRTLVGSVGGDHGVPGFRFENSRGGLADLRLALAIERDAAWFLLKLEVS